MSAHPYNPNHLPTDDEALALLDLAQIGKLEAAPDTLTRRLEIAASAFVAARESAQAPHAVTAGQAGESGGPSAMQIVPWFLAIAALLALAIPNLMQAPTTTPEDPAAFVVALFEGESAPADTVRASWVHGGDATGEGATGEVVWSDSENKGYMKFTGLRANNPSEEQYQLWIFDAERPTGDLLQFGEGLLTQRPVDGGVFDVGESGEVIIPIDAKLPVSKAAAFAVTVEPPGGVVVSDRSRVATLGLVQG